MQEGQDLASVTRGCAAAVGKMLLRLALAPWPAFVAWTIWRWFAVDKLGAPPVPYVVVGGLLESASLLRLRAAFSTEKMEYTVGTILTGYVLVPALILGAARLWLAFA